MIDKENNGTFFTRHASNRGNVFIFSPTTSAPLPVKHVESPTKLHMICAKFQESLYLELGNVILGGSKSVTFLLENPSAKKEAVVTIDAATENKMRKEGITLGFGDYMKEGSVCIPPKTSASCRLVWSPKADASIREVLTFKLNGVSPLQVTVHGVAGTGKRREPSPVKKEAKKMISTLNLLNSSDNNNNSKNTSKTKRPMRSLSQDFAESLTVKPKEGDWADKQMQSFTNWMNFTFNEQENPALPVKLEDVEAGFNNATEVDNSNNNTTNNANGNSSSSSSSSSSSNNHNNVHSLKGVMTIIQSERARQTAAQIFNEAEVSNVFTILTARVMSDQIAMRDDDDFHANLGMQDLALSMLFSYELPWLRLGLETVFGEAITPCTRTPALVCSSTNHKWKGAIKSFIIEKLFFDAGIQAQFTAKQKLFVAQEQKMKAMLRQHFCSRFLSLVLFLDIAKCKQVLPTLTLFQRSSTEFKSSKDVVVAFCRDFLKQQGDIVKYLSSFGYNLSFVQSYVDEFDFSVQNFALDLRDGVRLARLYELLARKTATSQSAVSDLSSQLRVPAGSLLQKKHNVELVLQQLRKDGGDDAVALRVDAKSVVEGSRDATLLLLWELMYKFELKLMVESTSVASEIQSIAQDNKWRQSVYSRADAVGLAVSVPIRDKDGRVVYPEHLTNIDETLEKLCNRGMTGLPVDVMLLQWCQAVTAKYNVPVYNLTSCLADGRVLCLMVHYYHPTILPTRLIKKTSATDLNPLNLSASSLEEKPQSHADLQQAVSNERKNFATLKKACNAIGGIPLMLPDVHSRQTPDEKTMTVFLGFLFTRLTESSKQVSAAIKIQRVFRRKRDLIRERFAAKMASRKRTPKKVRDTALVASASVVSPKVNICRTRRDGNVMEFGSSEKPATNESNVYLNALSLALSPDKFAFQALKEQEEKEVQARLDMEAAAAVTAAVAELAASQARSKAEAEAAEAEAAAAEVQALAEAQAAAEAIAAAETEAAKAASEAFAAAVAVAVAEALAVAKAKADAEAQAIAEARAIAESQAKADAEALAIAEAEAAAAAEVQALAEAQAAAEAIAAAETQAIAEAQAIAETQAKAAAEAMIAAEAEARAVAEATAVQEARAAAEAEAEAVALAEAESRAMAQAEVLAATEAEAEAAALERIASESRCLELAAHKIRSLYRARQPLIRTKKMVYGFRRLAAAWKSHQHRRQHSDPAVQAMLVRIKTADIRSRSNTSLRIGQLTITACAILCGGGVSEGNADSPEMVAAVTGLQMFSSVSEMCCGAFARCAAPHALVSLLRSCNRSEPHQELLRLGLLCLLHVCKHDNLTGAVAAVPALTDALVDLMQMFRDKRGIFVLACKLLSLLSNCSEHVKTTCRAAHERNRMDGLFHIIERQHRLEQRVRSVASARSKKTGPVKVVGRPSFESLEPMQCIEMLLESLK